ncbi:MAG: peptidoglycan-binding protein [Synechococcales cyanobacterium CRU_2_2]|nr:peptidoglycan-binding protein [Synechococcales cyanobacterium CRU_2_2]
METPCFEAAMFPYQDPAGSDLLQRLGALDAYRSKIQTRYDAAGREPNTRFVPIEHLSGSSSRLRAGITPTVATIPWNAFPRSRTSTRDDRLDGRAEANLQEEYVEWDLQFRVGGGGNQSGIENIVFTTEFPEYFEALADVSFEALVTAVKSVIPGANPTVSELLGIERPLAPLLADGVVGPATWAMLNQVTGLAGRSAEQPVLRRGAQGEAAAQLQVRLKRLNLIGTVDGDFGPATEAAVKKAQARYTGGGRVFRQNLNKNPWNNGKKGILCLAQQFNTLPFLFELVSQCSVPRPQIRPQQVCATQGVNCVPSRSSDPNVCVAAQNQALLGRALSLRDPARIRILELQGIWRLNGERVDVNVAPTGGRQTPAIWSLSRGEQRAVLRNLPGLTLDGAPITSGAQVARKVQVGADILVVPTSGLKV